MITKKGVMLLIMLFGFFIASLGYWQAQSITQAPAVSFITLTGEKIELTQLQGRPVIVTFWATDCASCIKEIPQFIELYNDYFQRGLKIIAIAMHYDPPSHVLAMTKAKQLPYDVALDLTAEHAKAFGHVQLIPSTFLISPSGKIVMKKTGVFEIMDMKQQIENLLKE